MNIDKIRKANQKMAPVQARELKNKKVTTYFSHEHLIQYNLNVITIVIFT